MSPSRGEIIRAIFSRRMLITFFLGFSSGLPLNVAGDTLKAWMTDVHVDLTVIGIFSLVGFPYSIKYLWAPLIDRFIPPFGGRRRGWAFITQALLAASFWGLGSTDPAGNPWMTAFFAVLVTFFSASQDIVLDAHRRDTLREEELGLGTSLFVNGYRIGMLVSGALALSLADQIPWNQVYHVLAFVMLACMAVTYFAPEPDHVTAPRTIRQAVVEPFRDFFTRKGVSGALLILAFIVLYKLGEMMAAAMTTPLILSLGFTKTELAAIVKTFGLAATIAGGLTGGIAMLRLGMNRSLWIFGILQAIGILGFALLAATGKSQVLLAAVIAFENLTSGMATAVFTAYLGSICNKSYSATQYALLSSFISKPRVFASAATGYLSKHLGWVEFYILCTIITIPGILLLKVIAPWSGGRPAQDSESTQGT